MRSDWNRIFRVSGDQTAQSSMAKLVVSCSRFLPLASIAYTSARPLPTRSKTKRPGPALGVGSFVPQAERARARAISAGISLPMGFMKKKVACRASLACF